MSMRALFFILVIALSQAVEAYSLRQYTNKEGLSNSAILSLYQDGRGYLWIGTCDGLNLFDGNRIRQVGQFESTQAFLSGNLINGIMETEENVLWVQTNYGLDRVETRQHTILNFADFKDNSFMARGAGKSFFILKDDGRLYYYDDARRSFVPLPTEPFAFNRVQAVHVDSHNQLWIYAAGKETRCYALSDAGTSEGGVPGLTAREGLNFSVYRAFTDGEGTYLIDESHAFYEFDSTTRNAYFVADLQAVIKEHGEVSSVIKQDDDYYIGFKNSGLVVLRYRPDSKVKYALEETPIHTGIFCLLKDRYQDIIWVGTDGQGVYMLFDEEYVIRNQPLNDTYYQLNNPVRAFFYDNRHTLWIGTKGSGIISMENYFPEQPADNRKFKRWTTGNSALADNSVYCFAQGRRQQLWIGTEEGLNCFSYATGRLEAFPVTADGKRVKYVHSICVLNDTTLWLSTVGEGIVKLELTKPEGTAMPRVKSARRITFDDGRMASNYFFTSFQEGDSVLWFGNRGYGAYRLDLRSEEIQAFRFDDVVNSRTANDIYAIHKNSHGYWFGTGSGLLHLNAPALKDRSELLSRNTVHGILEDVYRNLWISTNQGLVCFNPSARTGKTYDESNGLIITEFSDGAYFRDAKSGTLFFGGVDGFVTVTPHNYIPRAYVPDIHLAGLSVYGKSRNIYDFLEKDKPHTSLRLNHDQNFFELRFMAIDYINGNNYSYYYKLNGVSDGWIACGSSPSVVFSNLSPGEYTLMVKYRNDFDGRECRPMELKIAILPPWYLSAWAYWAYALLVLSVLSLLGYRLLLNYRRRQNRLIERMNLQKKEEIYESKLRFFTNITHEFCTPLALISGPCERILSYRSTDDYVRRYGEMIRRNAEKLNGLILELLEFRKLETGHKVLNIQPVPVSEKLGEIASSFAELVEKRSLDYRTSIMPDVSWNTDAGCFGKIADNLLSNAFKYTPEGGSIRVELKSEDGGLVMSVSNTGKGIKKENLQKIFDRYSILDAFEVNAAHSRNGLGLAICKSMVELLQGTIEVESTPGEWTTFTVRLPRLQLSGVRETEYSAEAEPFVSEKLSEPMFLPETTAEFDRSKRTVMIIDDDRSMLWFVSEIFAENYNVIALSNAQDALNALEMNQPDLIISDVMMPDTDGLSLARKVKQNKQLSHIPLILLSALHHEEEQMKGIASGAEAYVTKPFNVKYLEQMVDRLIQRERDLKEYYSSVLSSFKLEDGKFIHKEDQEFLNRIWEIIDRNLGNPELSIESLSAELGISTRQFYRKLKPVTSKTPTDLIKDYRLAVAERLLLTENLTIEEIMLKTGFVNRGTFYKQFSRRFGIPPKQYKENKEAAASLKREGEEQE